MEKQQSRAVSGQRLKRKAMSSHDPAAPPKLYRGVRMRSWGKWVSEIRQPKKRSRIWLGSYSTPEAAATAYDMALYYLRGPYAALNFPASIPRHAPPPDVSPQQVQKAAIAAGLAVDKKLASVDFNGSPIDPNGVAAANETVTLASCSSTPSTPSPELSSKNRIQINSPLPDLCCRHRTEQSSPSPSPCSSPSEHCSSISINDSLSSPSPSPSPPQAAVLTSVSGKPRPLLKLDLNVAMPECSNVGDEDEEEEEEQPSSSTSSECRNSPDVSISAVTAENRPRRPSVDMNISADSIDIPDNITAADIHRMIVNNLNFSDLEPNCSNPNLSFKPNSNSPELNYNPNFINPKLNFSSHNPNFSNPNLYFSKPVSKVSNPNPNNPSTAP